MECDYYGVVTFLLLCASLDHSTTSTIISIDNNSGSWKSPKTCGANDFMQSYHVSKDGQGYLNNDLSLSGVSMQCILFSTDLDGGGDCNSNWTPIASCNPGEAICGYQLRYETHDSSIFADNVRTSNSLFKCCLICKKTDGWFLDTGPKCSLCSPYCKTCSGSTDTECSSCFSFDTQSGTTCPRASNYDEAINAIDGSSISSLISSGAVSTSTCSGISWLGGWGVLGAGSSFEITISNKPEHYKLRIKLRFLKVGSWNGENGEIYVDGALQSINELNGISSDSGKLNFGSQCGGTDPTNVINVDFEMIHDKMPFVLKFRSTLNGGSAFWGISNLILGVYKCDASCETCSGSAATDCKTCFAGSSLYTDPLTSFKRVFETNFKSKFHSFFLNH